MNIKCSQMNNLPTEHARVKDRRYLDISVTCPLFDKNLCLWCCLHILDMARPTTRPQATASNADYERDIPKLLGRDWDNIWETCSRCSNR